MSRVVILSRTSQWGLARDAKWIEQMLREAHAVRAFTVASIDHHDPIAFTNPKPVDIQIHLEVPCRLAWPWAKVNIVVVNPERWPKTAWNWALEAADWVVFKCEAVKSLFPEVGTKAVVIPWRIPTPLTLTNTPKENKFLYSIGGSENKADAAKVIVSAWQPEWPPLEIWATSVIVETLQPLANPGAHIRWSSTYKTEREVWEAQKAAKFHIVASAAEGYGHTMAECATAESLPLWCDLPVQAEAWRILKEVGRIPTSDPVKGPYREGKREISRENVGAAVQSLLSLDDDAYTNLTTAFRRIGVNRVNSWREEWRSLLKSKRMRSLLKADQPLVLKRLPASVLPVVGIVTLTHNRPKWFFNMAQNILKTDYPSEKLRWIIVDDSRAEGRVDEQVLKFQQSAPHIHVEYISLTKELSVGAKRNRGCSAAVQAGAEVLMMMDDDDHYPKSSVEARVTYMSLLKVPCVYCARIQMYDCTKFISAMNVPPLDLGPAERVSEATLAFTRVFWEERPFPEVSVGEGEGFLVGREGTTAEIVPEGVIVSFLHGANATSRRVPDAEEANGCHYGFTDEYFLWLCERGEKPTPQ
jgi:hypothetical protein